MKQLISLEYVDKAIDRILKFLSWKPTIERVSIHKALGLISGIDVVSNIRLPQYLRATVDGYALRSSDVSMASDTNPVMLRCVSEVRTPLKLHEITVQAGECVYIETGCYLPQNLDAVIPVEECEVIGDKVLVKRSISKFENVALPGEELDVGDLVLAKGSRIRPWHLAALEVLGIEFIDVLALKASIIQTGSEFVEGIAKPYTISLVYGWLKEFGFIEVSRYVVGDNVERITELIDSALKKSDLVIVLGGTSMGRNDWSIKAIERLYPDTLIHGLALQPGKTTCLASKDGKPVIAMSGLPVAAFAVLEIVVNSLLSKWLRVEPIQRPKIRLPTCKYIPSKLGLKTLARVKIEHGCVEPIGIVGSGSLRSILLADGYVIVPEDVEGFGIGEEVYVYLLKSSKSV